jgi:hypothetical protein
MNSVDNPINVPRHSFEHLLGITGSAALRVFLIICSVARDGLPRMSARDLSARTGLTERTVFNALSQLESAICIARSAREPGPVSNELRILEWPPNESEIGSAPDCSPVPTPQAESVNQDNTPDIGKWVASCFRHLDEPESARVKKFIADYFDDDLEQFETATKIIASAGGVAASTSLAFALVAILHRHYLK